MRFIIQALEYFVATIKRCERNRIQHIGQLEGSQSSKAICVWPCDQKSAVASCNHHFRCDWECADSVHHSFCWSDFTRAVGPFLWPFLSVLANQTVFVALLITWPAGRGFCGPKAKRIGVASSVGGSSYASTRRTSSFSVGKNASPNQVAPVDSMQSAATTSSASSTTSSLATSSS